MENKSSPPTSIPREHSSRAAPLKFYELWTLLGQAKQGFCVRLTASGELHWAQVWLQDCWCFLRDTYSVRAQLEPDFAERARRFLALAVRATPDGVALYEQPPSGAPARSRPVRLPPSLPRTAAGLAAKLSPTEREYLWWMPYDKSYGESERAEILQLCIQLHPHDFYWMLAPQGDDGWLFYLTTELSLACEAVRDYCAALPSPKYATAEDLERIALANGHFSPLVIPLVRRGSRRCNRAASVTIRNTTFPVGYCIPATPTLSLTHSTTN